MLMLTIMDESYTDGFVQLQRLSKLLQSYD